MGAPQFIGSQRNQVSSAIALARAEDATDWVDMEMSDNKTDVVITIAAGSPVKEATLWLMAFAPSISTDIKKGENAGKVIAYHNVVRKMVPAGMWHGDAAKIVLPKSSVIPEDCKGWVALLQEGKVGRVIGAATGGVSSSS